MTTQLEQHIYLSRGIDYLGALGATLRNLLGYSTLAHELIQNADDARSSTWMVFDVRTAALVVDNDGVFTDCADVESPDCRWKSADSHSHMCDFHRFRRVASGDKRDQAGTAGAFGIGFTAVYQITDQPELISGGRHWILHEDRPEDQRIEVCGGCAVCKGIDIPRTRFILPWAFDSDSPLRKRLRADAVLPSGPEGIRDELVRSVPLAMLFLNRLEAVEIRSDGSLTSRLERLLDGEDVIIHDGTRDTVWHLLKASFTVVAEKLRSLHPGRIENKRSAAVTLAVPADASDSGVFCAFLPTQQLTGLPFHINADFFPTNDRKRIVLEQDYQSEWNRAAIQAGALALKANLDRLRAQLDHTRFWELLQSVRHAADEASRGRNDPVLASYWDEIADGLRHTAVVFSTSKQWIRPSEAVFLEREEESEAIPVLEALGLNVVHPDLRFAQNLLRSEAVGVRLLDVSAFATALQHKGLTKRTDRNHLPEGLSSESAMLALWKETDILLDQLERRGKHDQKLSRAELARYAIALCRDGNYWPCQEAFVGDEETIALFTALAPDTPFVAAAEQSARVTERLCPRFSAANAIKVLASFGPEGLGAAMIRAQTSAARLLHWFEGRSDEVLGSSQTKAALAALPMYPSAGGLKALTELALSGDFSDPLHLAGLVDLDQLAGRRDFLHDLGAQVLTFESYVTEHLPRAFAQNPLNPEQRRSLVRLLADELGKLRGDKDTRFVLTELPLVECQGGEFCVPSDVYFDNDVVRQVLGAAVHLAQLPADHSDAVREFYRWLGVAELPRLEAVLECIEALTADPPTAERVVAICELFSHLLLRHQQDEPRNRTLNSLCTRAWLPAKGRMDRWYRTEELFADFFAHLFDSQATFLDVPQKVLRANTSFLDFLGVRTAPNEPQVVAHLLHCAESLVPVNRGVYVWLNERAQHPAIANLVGKACLHLLPSDNYVAPNQVFWGDHPFGRLRHKLGPELRKFTDLFSQLGVRESPDHTHALAVIREIANDFGNMSRILDEEIQLIMQGCWRMLDAALDQGAIDADGLAALGDSKVICNDAGILNPPAWMFFEDRVGLAARFKGYLSGNVIPRPQGAWRAMRAAGVRSLAAAAESHLVEATDPQEDHLLLPRARERREQLARVLEFHSPGQADQLAVLDELRFCSVSELRVQFSVTPYDRVIHSDPEDVPAHFHKGDGTLYFVRREARFPWPAIARELAQVLCPDTEPGQLASALKDVLDADDRNAAQAVLDELGFPQVAGLTRTAIPTAQAVTDLGTDQESSAPDGNTGLPTQPLATANPYVQTAGDAIRELLGADSTAPQPPPPGLDQPEKTGPPEAGHGPGTGTGSGAGGTPGGAKSGGGPTGPGSSTPPPAKRPGYAVLRSYVMPIRPNDVSPKDREAQARRTALGQAGVDRVMEFEKSRCRIPQEMPPQHPGYDVESTNGDGAVERYIEVKSISADWRGADARMTKTQFDRARELGERYWLYVVERADSDDFDIHRIQDPATRANYFMFDPGWTQVEEDNDGGEGQRGNQQ